MLIKNRLFSFFIRLIIITLALTGILLVITNDKTTVPMEMLIFYTIQSNIITIIVSFILMVKDLRLLSFQGKKGEPGQIAPLIQMGNTFIILITFLVYATLLYEYTFSAGYEWEGIKFSIGNILLHYFVPLLTLADYLLFCKKGKVKFKQALLCLTYPLVYFVFIMIRGEVGGPLQNMGEEIFTYYPYPFLDVDKFGWSQVIINVVVLLVLMIGLIGLLTWADSRLSKRRLNLEKPS
ncbi:MAG TPA: Pr6Pr family membrane protein [Bacilli bacterium]|mgnify:FL=1|nr:MAG: hypothetical protein BWY97_00898 [Tenericutes bacterium ADurb.BinA124]HNZ50514.1 Pr6Pr family membrane protein [Bacilli bacterium]HPN60872.1 Pr6Pr family membrane protein [Bacilli bacterium]HPX84327.1 Pr6Pr family membrane protein [Bacilli bacterium]